jgi:hypothetical protein
MATHYNPKIATDGLVLCIDPANPKCYPGTGTTVTDISGASNNFILQNASAYIAGDRVFRFAYNGINWLERSTLLNGFTAGTVSYFTMIAFVKLTDASTTRFMTFDDLNSDTSNRLNYYMTTTALSGEKNNVYNISSGLGAFTHTNVWIMYAATISGLTSTFYRGTSSGVEVGTPQTLANAPEIGSYTLIGRRGVDTFFGGDISTFLLYNTALNSSQISQTFDGLRYRYGI